MMNEQKDIALTLTAVEVDFIGGVLMQLQYGMVARAGMLHLLGKIQQQANAPAADPDLVDKMNGAGVPTPPH
jgi:hypothetical protein